MNAIVVTDTETLSRVVADAVAKAMAEVRPVAVSPPVAPDPDALLTRDDVATLLKIDTRTLRRLEQESGALPRPIVVADRIVRWRHRDIMAMLDNDGKVPRKLIDLRFHSCRKAGSMSATNGGKPRG